MADVIDFTSKKTVKTEKPKQTFDMQQAVVEFLKTVDAEVKNNKNLSYAILLAGDTEGNVTVEVVGMISPAELSWAGVTLQQMAIKVSDGA